MRLSLRAIKILGLVWGLVVMALCLRYWQVAHAKKLALGLLQERLGAMRPGLDVRELNFLRGDYMVTTISTSGPTRHWTVNIRTGLVIGWETDGGYRRQSGAH